METAKACCREVIAAYLEFKTDAVEIREAFISESIETPSIKREREAIKAIQRILNKTQISSG